MTLRESRVGLVLLRTGQCGMAVGANFQYITAQLEDGGEDQSSRRSQEVGKGL